MTEKFTRKSFLILPSFQLKLVGFLVGLLLIGSIIHGFFLYSITARGVEDGFLSVHNRLRSTWEILKPAIILTNGISFLLLSLCFMTATIFISHRLIGPLFKISGRLRELSEGRLDLPPVKLRKGDEGQILSDAVNQLQNAFQKRFEPLISLRKRLNSSAPPTEAEVRETLETALKNLDVGES